MESIRISAFIDNINLVGIIVLITFVYGALYLKPKNKTHKILLYILLANILTELFSLLLIAYSMNYTVLYLISFIFHNFLWLLLLSKSTSEKFSSSTPALFLCICILNFCFWEGSDLNQKIFTFGALLYIIVFLYKSFKNLMVEDLSFFSSNIFILLFAPVLFFFGMSLSLAFGDSKVLNYKLYKDISLYIFINSFINIIYYSSIMLYIYREKKLKHD